MNKKSDFTPEHGHAVQIAPLVQRITAPNANPFTFTGTNSYLVGHHHCALIDPGPDLDAHFETIMATLSGRTLSHIILTHTHKDHASLAARIQSETNAITMAEGAHRLFRPLSEGETNPFQKSAVWDFKPDILLSHGDLIETEEWCLETVATPGHTANHIALGLKDCGLCFSGDHVMGWSTTVVGPPDGSMASYLKSLDTLLAQNFTTLYPGHGGPVNEPDAYIRAAKAHRLFRESAILERVREGDQTIETMVLRLYKGTDPKLHGAAGLTILAHLEHLIEKRKVYFEGVFGAQARYFPMT